MKSAAISAAFSFVTALGEFCSPASKTYSSVPPSLAAPRYRNNSIDIAGATRERVIRIVLESAAAQRHGAVAVEFDFVDPIAMRNCIDQLCFHWLQKAVHAGGSGGMYFHDSSRR